MYAINKLHVRPTHTVACSSIYQRVFTSQNSWTRE